MLKDSMQKKVLTPMNGEKFFFLVADGTVKIFGGDQDLRTYTLIQDSPDRGEEQGNLMGESDGSSSTPFQDSSLYDGEARDDFWSIPGNFIYRRHVEPSVKLYVPREARRKLERQWDRDLSDTWTRFTRLTILDEKPPDRYTWADKKANDNQARLSVARNRKTEA